MNKVVLYADGTLIYAEKSTQVKRVLQQNDKSYDK